MSANLVCKGWSHGKKIQQDEEQKLTLNCGKCIYSSNIFKYNLVYLFSFMLH